MTFIFQNMNRRTQIVRTLITTIMGLLLTACTFTQSFTQSKVPDEVFVDIPRGAVFFQTAEDGWFRTTHPFDLSSELLAAVFRGIHVQISPTNPDPGERVFSDENTEFLSPLMSIALSKATKSQVVRFRVLHELDGSQETTGGILYIQGRLLHLTLTHFRARHEGLGRDVTSQLLTPNPTGLSQQQIRFSPQAATRSSRNEQPNVIATPPLVSLVIDYEALIEMTALPPRAVRSAPLGSDKLSVIRQTMEPIFQPSRTQVSRDPQDSADGISRGVQIPGLEKKDELEALKDEVHRLHRKLLELERNAPTAKQP